MPRGSGFHGGAYALALSENVKVNGVATSVIAYAKQKLQQKMDQSQAGIVYLPASEVYLLASLLKEVKEAHDSFFIPHQTTLGLAHYAIKILKALHDGNHEALEWFADHGSEPAVSEALKVYLSMMKHEQEVGLELSQLTDVSGPQPGLG